jgi:hypothetical protein
MRKEQLRMNEQKKYEIIKKLVEQGGSKNRVALQLSLSRRQIDRLLIIYKKRGKSGFIHGNRNKKPSIAHDKSPEFDTSQYLKLTLTLITSAFFIVKLLSFYCCELLWNVI